MLFGLPIRRWVSSNSSYHVMLAPLCSSSVSTQLFVASVKCPAKRSVGAALVCLPLWCVILTSIVGHTVTIGCFGLCFRVPSRK